MRVALMLILVGLAGCASTDRPTEPEAIVDNKPEWSVGDWWQYNLRVDGEDFEVTLVYDGSMFMANDKVAAEQLASHRFPLIGGGLEDGKWVGEFYNADIVGGDAVKVAHQWMKWPITNATSVEVETSRQFNQGSDEEPGIAVSNLTDSTADLVYSGYVVGTGRYDAEIGWLTQITTSAPASTTWNLVASGINFTGSAWDVKETRRLSDTLSGSTLASFGVGGGDQISVTYDLNCGGPGAVQFRVYESDTNPDSYVSYTDACPAQALRVERFSPPGDGVRYLMTTANDAMATAGTYTMQAFATEERSF